MRTIYRSEEQQKTTSTGGGHKPFQLTGLSITIPCRSGGSPVFIAYGSTDVVTLGQGMQPVAMPFEQVGRAWELAAIVQRASGTSSWPALCRHSSAAGTRADTFPDGAAIATSRTTVVHHATDTYITTYTAIDPLRSAGGTVALDGFFGWPLTTIAS